MKIDPSQVIILMADDDEEDCMLAKEALKEARLLNELHFVHDGEELLDYLNRRGSHADRAGQPLPGLILLDLNMPRMDGREALKAIKSDAALRRIPIVVMTTSKVEEDIVRTYDLGVNSFIIKPISFESLVSVMRTLAKYWLEIVELPQPSPGKIP